MKKVSVGLAVLGFQGYSDEHAKAVIDTLKKEPIPVLAFLFNSFGKSRKNLKEWYKVCGPNAITQVYLSNEVDRRKSRVDRNSLKWDLGVNQFNYALETNDRGVIRSIKARAKRLNRFHKKFGNGKLVIVCGLEHQMTERAARVYVKTVKSVVDDSVMVGLNPVITGPFRDIANADFLEIHEVTKKNPPQKVKFVATTDGYDICSDHFSPRITTKMSHANLDAVLDKWSDAEYFLLWHSSFNSLVGNSAENPPPSERKSSIDVGMLKHLHKHFIKPRRKRTEFFTPKCCQKLTEPEEHSGLVIKLSEHTGTVVVLPPDFPPLSKVVLHSPNNERFKFKFSGMANPHHGKERQHWRISKDPHLLPKNAVLRCVVKKTFWQSLLSWNERCICIRIKDPSKTIRIY